MVDGSVCYELEAGIEEISPDEVDRGRWAVGFWDVDGDGGVGD